VQANESTDKRYDEAPKDKAGKAKVLCDMIASTGASCQHDMIGNIGDGIIAHVEALEFWQLCDLKWHENQLIAIQIDQT